MASFSGVHKSRVLIVPVHDADQQVEKVSENLRCELSVQSDIDCAVLPARRHVGLRVPDHDVLVLGLAARACPMPGLLRETLAALPEGTGRLAFGFATSSAFGSRALLWLGLKGLAERGYHVIGGAAVRRDGSGQDLLVQAITGFVRSDGAARSSIALRTALFDLVRRQPSLLEIIFVEATSLLAGTISAIRAGGSEEGR